tara:strand:- start:1006 stop:2001 length:996 start_codon:yes stop_codon:yes gene_type:complete
MIFKFFEIKKKNLNPFKYFLLYGKNRGLIEETIKKDLEPILSKNKYNYEENEILNNPENFKENILNKSFFENDKLIIIQRATDKIFKIIEEFVEIEIEDITIILISDILDKKSKLRNFFEKNNKTVCIAFYEDTDQTLNFIVQNFLKKNKINFSQENINILIERAKGDRINLNNELSKIEYFCKNKSKIEVNDIIKLTNLSENYSASELVENSLAQNKRKTLNILNENNFSNDDCILILRIYLNKLKRLLKIQSDLKHIKSIDQVITNFKPPIFWKDKDLVKKQVKIWGDRNLNDLISNTNNLELQIKENPSISILLLTNFIIEKTLKPSS